MKSSEVAVGIVRALFEDIALTYPTDRKDLIRDFDRIKSLILYDFPSAVSMLYEFHTAFLTCIENSHSRFFEGKPLSAPKKGEVLPKFLRSLLMRIFMPDGTLSPHPDSNAILFIRQVTLMFKKMEEGLADGQDLLDAAVEQFRRDESRMRPPTLLWGSEFKPDAHLNFLDAISFDPGGLLPSDNPVVSSPAYLETLHGVADRISGWIGEFNPLSPDCVPRHGPGAVADKTRFEDKFAFGSWPRRLERLFPISWFFHLTDVPDVDENEVPAKLIPVPKDIRGPRIIASEPSYLMYTQQSFKDFLRNRIRETALSRSIDIENQFLSREDARLASITRVKATIDLKSASDLLSLWTVERVFRKNPTLLEAMNSTRSQWINFPNGESIILKKLAPMGNAYTFPVQTIVYLIFSISAICIARGVIPTDKNIRKLLPEVRVYGDDIIIPVDSVDPLTELLTYNGLKVNSHKSFKLSAFRESCGFDAYSGDDVTPAYVKSVSADDPESVNGRVASSNSLFEKGFWNASNAVLMTVPKWIRDTLPIRPDVTTGPIAIMSYSGHDYAATRFNRDLQRDEYLSLELCSRVKVTTRDGIRNFIQYITERPPSDSTWKSGTKVSGDAFWRRRWSAY